MQVDVAAASRKCSQYLRRRSIGRQEQVRPVENKSSGRQTDVGVIRSERGTHQMSKPQVGRLSSRWRQGVLWGLVRMNFPFSSYSMYETLFHCVSSSSVSFESPMNLGFSAISFTWENIFR